jgi:uncharacterized protein
MLLNDMNDLKSEIIAMEKIKQEVNMTEQKSIQRQPREAKNKKSKMNQIPIGVLLLLGVIILCLWLVGVNEQMVFYLVTGVCFGFILQRSRFCFTAAFRDPNLTKSTSLTRAVLIAFAVATIGFTAIKYGATDGVLDMVSVNPLSLATAIGAFLFGIGMVIAGGCASGTLMRVGEGFTMQWLALLFFIIGSLIADSHKDFWTTHFHSGGTKVFLPNVLGGYLIAAIVQLVVIACLYFIAEKYENKKIGGNNA